MIKTAIIGCGFWGRLFIPKLLDTGKFHIRYLVDQDPETLKQLKEKYGFIDVLTHVDQLVRDMHVELVFLLGPISTHAQFARTLLEAGKSIYLEPPLALNPKEVESLIGLAEKRGSKIIFGNTNEYNFGIRFLRREIEEDCLGELYYLAAQRLNFKSLSQSPNAIIELGVREIALAQSILREKVSSVQCVPLMKLGSSCVPAAHLFLNFETGCTYAAHLSVVSTQKLREVVVVGRKKMIRFDDATFDRKITEYCFSSDFVRNGKAETFVDFSLQTSSGDIKIPQIAYGEPLRDLAYAIHDLYKSKEAVPDRDQHWMVHRILSAALVSAQEARVVEIG